MERIKVGLSLHEDLWRQNRDLAEACLRHPFVRGLADGSLASPAFRRYVAQDAFFLGAFAKAYAVAIARSAKLETRNTFRDLLDATFRELRLHALYSQKLGIDLVAVRPYAATSAYTDFLLATAWHSSLEETMAAMTPCMRLYAYLGQELAQELAKEQIKTSTDSHPYREWIDTYSGTDFQTNVTRLESLLDGLAADRPPVRQAYRYALECELNFFSAPLETGR